MYYLLTGVSFEQNLEGCARPWTPRTYSDTGPGGPYTCTRHIRVMYEGPMIRRAHQPLHDLAVSRVRQNPQGSVRTLSASAPWRRPWRPRAGSFAPYAGRAPLPRMPLT
jgi:hypothetical protein